MQWTKKKILAAIAGLMLLWIPTIQAEETETLLHWKNGDTLPGQLLESQTPARRKREKFTGHHRIFRITLLLMPMYWTRLFSRNKRHQQRRLFASGRYPAISGWLISSAQMITLFSFSSKRHGQFRVNRDMIYTLESREHSNLLFDGSQLTAWKLPEQDKDEKVGPFSQEAQPSWHADRGGRPQDKYLPRRTSFTHSTGTQAF